MAEYIESKCRYCFNLAACAAWIRHGSSLYSDFSYSVADCPYYVSSTDVVEVVHSSWVGFPNNEVWDLRCDKCHLILPFGQRPETMHYCPNCGAKMDGERRDTDEYGTV